MGEEGDGGRGREKAEETRSEARLRKQVEAGATRPACACAFSLPFPPLPSALAFPPKSYHALTVLLRLSNLIIRFVRRIAPNVSHASKCCFKTVVSRYKRDQSEKKKSSIRLEETSFSCFRRAREIFSISGGNGKISYRNVENSTIEIRDFQAQRTPSRG